jgi:hypothetical protein
LLRRLISGRIDRHPLVRSCHWKPFLRDRRHKLPAQTPGDTRIKLALFQRDGDETDPAAESIIRDLRRSLKRF